MAKFRISVNYGKFFVDDDVNQESPRYKQLCFDTDEWLSSDFAKFLCLLEDKGVINDFVVYSSNLPF